MADLLIIDHGYCKSSCDRGGPQCVPIWPSFDDQMFGLSIVAAGHLEEDREKHIGPVAWPDSMVLFHLLNRGLWDQQLVDAPQEPSSRAIRYSAVMGE